MLLSLDGLSIGDAYGQRMFFGADHSDEFLPPGPWPWTDDTHMALSVVEVLARDGHIDQDALAAAFARGDFLAIIRAHVPSGLVHDGIERACSVAGDRLEQAAEELGVGRSVSAQDTVPFCLWMAAHHLDDYERAVRWTARAGGDADTTCAIVGGIVALSARNIPREWRARREPLPAAFAFLGDRA